MQRCPYLHEMRERLLGDTVQQQPKSTTLTLENMERDNLLESHQRQLMERDQVGTVVKCNPDGFGSHTSPAHQRTPLVPKDLGEDFSLDDDFSDCEPVKKKWHPKNAKTSLFIVTSLVYAMLLIVVCIAYVLSDVTTHRIPVMYYEGFFTYLYGVSILFLLYVFCFLLQESACCNSTPKPKPPKKEKVKKEKKPKKEKDDGKGGKDKGKDKDKDKGGKPSPFQEKFPKKKRDLVREKLLQKHDFKFQDPIPEAEANPTSPKTLRKRKTTQDQSCGSFFLRVGAIAFGLGTMIYTGLEIGSFFEIPFDSPCHQILRGVNPLLQMIFTFMQMYFIFMNSRLNIHRFKVLARFGLMHIAATNLCVWIRTLVLESLKEITIHHQRRIPEPEKGPILDTIRHHTLKHADTVMGTELHPNDEWENVHSENLLDGSTHQASSNMFSKIANSGINSVANLILSTTAPPSNVRNNSYNNQHGYQSATPTPPAATTESTTITETSTKRIIYRFTEAVANHKLWGNDNTTPSTVLATAATTTVTPTPNSGEKFFNNLFGIENQNASAPFERLESLFPHALTALTTTNVNNANTSCGRVNIMGTIVEDSTPYLYPFIIEYSLIGAAVIYVMWKHIGRNPRYSGEEDLEHRLEVMLSRRAVAMAQAHSGRVDCVGASKGLFFGLLLLCGSLICLILFFVLARHPKLWLLAIYLADVSHSALIGLSLIAIIIGFIRVKQLKFRCEDQSDLNDILLRISAFGIFIYSVFSVIAGSLNALEKEPNLLVTITGVLVVLQVILQLLFIADVSRRRVHLPEHDRSKPGRQIVTFLLICNISMFAIYTFEAQKVFANRVQLDFYGFIAWSIIQRITLPLCIFHRFHSAVTLAEIWKTTYKARLE